MYWFSDLKFSQIVLIINILQSICPASGFQDNKVMKKKLHTQIGIRLKLRTFKVRTAWVSAISPVSSGWNPKSIKYRSNYSESRAAIARTCSQRLSEAHPIFCEYSILASKDITQ